MDIVLVNHVVIDGDVLKPGTQLHLKRDLALNLIQRQKAVQVVTR